jgi:hypothetical protein
MGIITLYYSMLVKIMTFSLLKKWKGKQRELLHELSPKIGCLFPEN